MSPDRFGQRKNPPSSLTQQQLETLGEYIKVGLSVLYVAQQAVVPIDAHEIMATNSLFLNKDSSLRSE